MDVHVILILSAGYICIKENILGLCVHVILILSAGCVCQKEYFKYVVVKKVEIQPKFPLHLSDMIKLMTRHK